MINDKFNTIYFNGCSFTEGGGFEYGKYWVRNAYKEQYGFEYKSEKDVCYPTLIKNKLGINVINEAKSGSGSERIIRKAWEYIHNNTIEELRKTLFIFEVPGAINRLDVFSNKYNKYLVANVTYDNKGNIEDTQTTLNWIYGPQLDEEYRNNTRRIIREYSEHFIHPVKYEQNIAYSFLGLFSFFYQNGIEFYVSGDIQYFISYLSFDKVLPNFNYNHLLKVNINDKIYHSITHMCGDTKTTIVDEVGKDVVNDGHPGYKGHQMWADGIIEFLNNEYL